MPIKKVIEKAETIIKRILSYIVYRLIYIKHSILFKTTCSSGVTKFKRKTELIVSLTTIPQRISRVHLCINSLLVQSVKPDRIILWLTESSNEKFPTINSRNLPKELRKLIERGLEIKWYKDIRSYRKLIPTLMDYPNSLYVTADDDILYSKHWLKQLYYAHLAEPQYVHCHRAHLMRFNEDGQLLPYQKWDWFADGILGPSLQLFPTSGAGIIYSKLHLYGDTTREDLFLSLCPYADDVWLKAMTLLANVQCKKVKKKSLRIVEIGNKGNETLTTFNVVRNGNDTQIKAINNYYKVFDRIGTEA